MGSKKGKCDADFEQNLLTQKSEILYIVVNDKNHIIPTFLCKYYFTFLQLFQWIKSASVLLFLGKNVHTQHGKKFIFYIM